jgi:predicted nucleic acid-binding protein
MKAYWDSSAIIESWTDAELRLRLRQERGWTRPHSLCEAFSSFTGGNLSIRMDADDAAEVISNLATDLDFVDLTAPEVLDALKEARKRGVRGGRVHDFMHAVAAKKSGADAVLTLDENDFDELVFGLKIEQV